MDWDTLPLVDVPVALLVWPCHDIHPDHLHPHPGQTTGPIRVQRLLDGSLFIHDGRHRAIRAQLAGHHTIQARVYE